jgi:histidinol-phosphate aminotransferase
VIDRLQRLRAQGIALRDCQSFGLPGWVRVGLRPSAEQAQWLQAWDALATNDVNPHALEAAQ